MEGVTMHPREPSPLILHVFPSFTTGGSQTRFAAIANHFGPQFRHAIIAMDGDTGCRTRLDPSLQATFHAVPVRHGRTLGNIRPFRAMLRQLAPNALFTYNWGTIDWTLANLGGLVRQVHVEDGFGPEERTRQLQRRVWMRRLFLRRRTVVLPSRTLVRLATETWRLDPAWVRYVPNGIDLARFAPMARVPGPVLVGTVAALRPEKNLGRLIRAFAQRPPGPPARLMIIGDGPERPALAALAQSLGVMAEFSGHVDQPAALIRQFDIFALSSDTEQMPLSLLEGMAAGCAVVATDVGDVRQMVAVPNQPFITARDDAALAVALGRLVADPALMRTLGAANRARAVAEYDQAAMFAAWGVLMRGP